MIELADSDSIYQNFDWSAIFDRIDKILPGFDLRSIYRFTDLKQEFQVVASRGFPNPSFASRLGFKLNQQLLLLFESKEALILPNVNFFKDHPFDRQTIHLYRFASGGSLPTSSIFLPFSINDNEPKLLIILDRFHKSSINPEKVQGLYREISSIVSQILDTSNAEHGVPEEPLRALRSVISSKSDYFTLADTLEDVLNKLSYLIMFDQAQIWQDSRAEISSNNIQADIKINTIHFSRSIRSFIDQKNPLSESDPELPKELSLLGENASRQLFIPLQLIPESSSILALTRISAEPFSTQDLLQAALFSEFFHSSRQLDPNMAQMSEQIGDSDRFKQQARQTAVTEAMSDGVLVTDAINKIQYVNSALYFLTGIEGKSEQHTIESFSSQFGNDLGPWKDHILTWSLTKIFIDPNPSFSDHIELKNGRVLSIHLSPIIMDAEFLGTVSIFRDVTYEFAFDRLKTDFITSISHELRTPLTSISGYIDLMLMGVAGSLNDPQQSYMRTIKDNSFRLNNLINDLLELTTIEAGNFQLRVQSFDLVSLAREIARKIESKQENRAKNIQVTFDHPADLPFVHANQDRTRQIIENLINNACIYSSEDGTVNVSITPADDFLRVSVHNQNIVIPPEHEVVIFDKFYKGDDPSVQILQGSGLGLPILKQLVELQMGKIWVTNDQELPGSTFTFTLPVWIGKENDG